MFERIYRDVGEYVSLRQIMGQFETHLRSLADELAVTWPRDQAAERRQVILRHAAKFATWHSLEAEGVDDKQKVALIAHWLQSSTSTA